MPERDDKTLEISGINITHPDQTMFPMPDFAKGIWRDIITGSGIGCVTSSRTVRFRWCAVRMA